jgi:predicted RNA-binding protein YlqC (UPF0109 family)
MTGGNDSGVGEYQSTGIVSLVDTMVRALVDAPQSVSVMGVRHGGCLAVNIVVAPADIGKLIGRQGRTARSLRTIVNNAAAIRRVRCEINIAGAVSGEEAGEA